MNSSQATTITVVILAVAAIAYIALSGGLPTINPTSTITANQVSNTIKTTQAHTTTVSGYKSTILPSNTENETVTLSQVISALGTSWTAASQHNYGASNIILANASIMISGYGIANFSNGGSFLTVEWIKFNDSASALNYINSTFHASYPSATSPATGSYDNATYLFYAGDEINKGQAASVMYAYYNEYGIIIFNQGTTFPLMQGEQLLGYQISDFTLK